jgi:hypothetical protein
MGFRLLVLLATAAPPTQDLPFSPTEAEQLVRVRNVSFDPAELSVSYEQVVALGVTAYKTTILWQFADGTTISEPLEADWFLSDGLINVGLGTVVNPLSAQTLVPSTPSRPARYVRTPRVPTPLSSLLVGADVKVIATVHASGVVFGDRATLYAIFEKRQVLQKEYEHWLRVIAGVWQDDSPIATLRTIVPELEKSRPSALGEQLRLVLKESADSMLFFSERDLADAPRLLNAFVRSIEQERELLSTQSPAR